MDKSKFLWIDGSIRHLCKYAHTFKGIHSRNQKFRGSVDFERYRNRKRLRFIDSYEKNFFFYVRNKLKLSALLRPEDSRKGYLVLKEFCSGRSA